MITITLGINSAVSEIVDIDFSSKYLITSVQHSFLFSPSGKAIVLFKLTDLMWGWFYSQTSSEWWQSLLNNYENKKMLLLLMLLIVFYYYFCFTLWFQKNRTCGSFIVANKFWDRLNLPYQIMVKNIFRSACAHFAFLSVCISTYLSTTPLWIWVFCILMKCCRVKNLGHISAILYR